MSWWVPLGVGQQGDYLVSVDQTSINVRIESSLFQNITQLPKFSFVLTDQNSSTLEDALTSSIRTKVPQARLNETSLRASSDGTIMTIDLKFRLSDVVSTGQSGSEANVAWRSFRIEEDLQFSGVGINLVGKHYLAEELSTLVDQAMNPLPQIRTTFQLNGERAIPLEIQQLAPNLNLLDFSPLATPLTGWSTNVSLAPAKVTWQKDTGFDLVAITTIREPLGEQIIIASQAVYKVTARIEAPSPAHTIGDLVFFGQGIFEIIMVGIMAIIVSLAVSSFIVERRLISQQSRRRRK